MRVRARRWCLSSLLALAAGCARAPEPKPRALDATVARDVAIDGPARRDAATDARRSSRLDAAIDGADAGDASADAADGWTTPTVQCLGHRLHDEVERTAKPCLPRTIERVRLWNPDAVVVLGGGMLPDGDPSCATVQRGYLAGQLLDALTPPPVVFLSGNGTSGHPHRLDALDARCVRARIVGEAEASPRASTASRARAARAADAVLDGQVRAMTEAEAMCAVVLQRTEPSRRDATLARLRFENRAMSTEQNALLTRPMIAAGGFARVLVLTSPVIKRFGRGLDVHADRALDAFRTVRRGGRWSLAGLGCPIFSGVATWFDFEPVPSMPEGMRSAQPPPPPRSPLSERGGRGARDQRGVRGSPWWSCPPRGWSR